MERLRDHPGRPQRVTVVAAPAAAAHRRLLAEVEAAERAEGWLARCEERGVFLEPAPSLLDALAVVLRGLGGGPVLEVCAGDGALADGLRRRGVRIHPTDAAPPPAGGAVVERLDAAEALRRHRPRVVLGSFVPVDAGIDRAVLDAPSVQHYLVLGARVGGVLGSAALWSTDGWRAEPLREVARWMVTRHDGWIGAGLPLLARGEAWLLVRTSPAPLSV